ncbi:MAG: peptidoglycan DD-metalloendopeptidase family protein [Candidatus Gracilibacteria bacterium]|jgi:murein DD-endopeptidase MepM/ murein hydrolase activator NlpD
MIFEMQKILSLLLVFSLFLGPVAQPRLARAEEPISTETLTEIVQESSLLLQLKQKLAQMQYRYTLFEQNVEQAKVHLIEIDAAITNLEMIVDSLNNQIHDNKKQVTSVKTQKERKSMDIEDLEEEVQILEFKVADQKKLVGELMSLIYLKREIYYTDDEVNPVKLLASPGSVSETLQNLTYLELVEEENKVQIETMNSLTEDLAEKWAELRTRKAELDQVDLELADEQDRLIAERHAQEELLNETQAEKTLLEGMLSSSDDKKEDLLKDIEIYRQNVASMEEKLRGMNALLTEDQQTTVAQIEADMAANFDANAASAFLQLDWPVSPGTGLTAFFDDGGYKELFGVAHGALDIRAKQGSPISAPADGVVSSVVYDANSTNYAYIQIAHRMGVMTVYGHISAPAVSSGDYVTRGQIIGTTGAMPGSVGAGVRTTGPHLHFEVWQDGIRVDPLRYLSLDEVPMDSLPEQYLDQVQNALEEQIREIQDAIGL